MVVKQPTTAPAPCSQSHQPWSPTHPHPTTQTQHFMASARNIARTTAIGELLKCWYGPVPIRSIKAGNAAELLTYGFWYRSVAQMEAAGLGHVPMEMLKRVEEAFGYRCVAAAGLRVPLAAGPPDGAGGREAFGCRCIAPDGPLKGLP